MANADNITDEEEIEIESIEAFMKLAVSGKPSLEYNGVTLGILEVNIQNNFAKFEFDKVLINGRCVITCKLAGYGLVDGVHYEIEGVILGGKPNPTIRIVSVSNNHIENKSNLMKYFDKTPSMKWTAYWTEYK